MLIENKIPDIEIPGAFHFVSQPIGVDIYGNHFWIFSSQEKLPAVAFENTGKSFGWDQSQIIDPCIFIRSRAGEWFYHSGSCLSDVLSFFLATNQNQLAGKIAERWYFTRTRYNSKMSLCSQANYHAWFERKSAIERWASAANLYTGPNELLRCRQLEAHFARCHEARMCVYYALLFPRETSENEKDYALSLPRKSKELTLIQLCDMLPVAGPVKADCLKRLASATIATRIHSDQSICAQIVSNLSKSQPFEKQPRISSPANDQIFITEDLTEKNAASQDFANLTDYLANLRKRSGDASNPKSKAILQLNLQTEEVLRIYSSGKEAANFMNVSQSGISLCLNGLKSESYGFKWRTYEGIPIDCKTLQYFLFFFSLNDIFFVLALS